MRSRGDGSTCRPRGEASDGANALTLTLTSSLWGCEETHVRRFAARTAFRYSRASELTQTAKNSVQLCFHQRGSPSSDSSSATQLSQLVRNGTPGHLRRRRCPGSCVASSEK